MMWLRIRIIFFSLIIPFCLLAQKPLETSWRDLPNDSLKDLTDLIARLMNSNENKEQGGRTKNHVQIGVFPAIGYTLQTGFAAVVSANAVIYKKHHHFNKDSTSLPSTIAASFSYSQKEQIIAPVQAVIYFNNNNTILVSDWRILKYPTYTYGLGMNTTPLDSNKLHFQYFKFHTSLLFKIYPNIFIGGGYSLDYFWDIEEKYPKTVGNETDFEKYGSGKTSLSSGVSLNLLRDTRDNPISAYRGSYANILLIPRFQFLGSDQNWTSLLVQYRTFLRFPASSNNILAFWSYNWLTLSGRPPYLMLPSTGWDKTFNTGRGYIQGRFRSNNMLDAEAEYRIQLTRNGLFGMVVFTNFESFTEINTWQFGSPAPAGGLGLRIKLNKYSRTNIAIDYGWGRQGSKGFFVNLGEAF
jgi:outer membrane protein assembly factor BamA